MESAPVDKVSAWVEEPLERLFDELPLGLVHLDQRGQVLHRNLSAAMLIDGPAGVEIQKTLAEMTERAKEPGGGLVESALSFGPVGEVRVLLSIAACLDGFLAVLERNALTRLRAENRVMRELLASATDPVPVEVATHRALASLGSTLAGSYLVLYERADDGVLRCLGHTNVPNHSAVLGRHPVDDRQSLVGRVASTGQPLQVANLARSFFPFERGLPGADRLSALALPVSAAGQPVGVLFVCGARGMLTDGELKLVQGLADAVGTLINHKRRDRVLKLEQQSTAALLANLPDAVFELTRSGRITLATGRADELLGRTVESLKGERLADYLRAEDQPAFEALCSELTVSRHRLAEVEVMRGERLVPCEVSAWATEGVEAPVIRALFRDISDRRSLEAEVNKVRDVAMQRERLASIGQLAAGVAHEINNPLSFVKANVTLLIEELADFKAAMTKFLDGQAVPGPEERAAVTKFLAEATELTSESVPGVNRIANIVKNLKGMARHQPGERILFDPLGPVLQAVQFFSGAKHCKDRIELRLSSVPLVKGEPGGLSQAVLNLLDNAFDAVGGKGRLTVSSEDRASHVAILVADDGPGIPPEVQRHLFEPFFTTKGQGKGTGLGLHISRDIVVKAGGDLRFQTGPTGTTFIIELPVADDASTQPAGPSEGNHG